MEPQANKRTVRPDAEAIKRLRLAKGWRAEDLAEKAICSPKTIENIERGANVYVVTLRKIAKALGIEVMTLIQGTKAISEQKSLVPINEPPNTTTPIDPHPKVQITVDIPFGNFDGPQHLIDFVKHVKEIAHSTDDFESNNLTTARIYKVLLDYRNGKIDKYEAMDALDLDDVYELLAFLARYEIPPELSGDYFQSDPSAPPAKDFFTEDDP